MIAIIGAVARFTDEGMALDDAVDLVVGCPGTRSAGAVMAAADPGV